MLTHLMSSRNSHRLYNGTKTHSKNDTLRSAISTRIIPAPPLLKRTCDNSYLLSIGIIQTSSPAVPSIRYRITPSSTTLSIWTTRSNLNAGKIYPISPREQKELDKFLEENLASGRIRPSKSPQAAPFFFTAKMEEVNAPGSDPGLRPIQDYRYLNSHTIKNRYPPSSSF